MRYVMKFGGSSLAGAKGIRNAVEIVKESLQSGCQLVVVVSAFPEVTSELVSITTKAIEGDIGSVNSFVERQLEHHRRIATECIQGSAALEMVLRELKGISKELGGILRSIARLEELTPRSKDFVLSFGERLSAPIFCGAANDAGIKAVWLTGGETGITTNEAYGDSTPLMDITIRQVKNKLERMLESRTLPIVAGFGASTPRGVTTTLGRGGSDYTATIIGAALSVDEVVLWKDVDGLMTADPTIEAGAKVLPHVSYAEASEMAYFGTKVIHPRALEPVADRKIPVRIRNAFNRKSEGTLVAGDTSERSKEIVKAITMIKKVALINVTGSGMSGLPGVAAKVFRVLGDAGVNILMISQSSSEAGISFVTARDHLERAKSALELSILGAEVVRDISTEDDVCIIAAVGAEMKGTPGVAARVFSAVAKAGLNVRMIAQGSSELNISFVVTENDGPKAVRALHIEFGLDST